MLNQDIHYFENNVDPDQLASEMLADQDQHGALVAELRKTDV